MKADLPALRAAIVGVVADAALADLTLRQVAVLILLDREPIGRRHVRMLAESVRISKPAVTRALNRLELLSYAGRVRGEKDRRDVQGSITPRGRIWLRCFGAAGTAAATKPPPTPTRSLP